MARIDGFAALVEDLLRPLGGVTIRRMFGGHGIFRDGVMFALIADDRLYLKTDQASRTRFEDAGLEPFVYDKQGRATVMSYYQAPDAALDDQDVMQDWATTALEAALRQRRTGGGRGRSARAGSPCAG
jgi:DNA transformation protein